jgi:hypothetical protein
MPQQAEETRRSTPMAMRQDFCCSDKSADQARSFMLDGYRNVRSYPVVVAYVIAVARLKRRLPYTFIGQTTNPQPRQNTSKISTTESDISFLNN